MITSEKYECFFLKGFFSDLTGRYDESPMWKPNFWEKKYECILLEGSLSDLFIILYVLQCFYIGWGKKNQVLGRGQLKRWGWSGQASKLMPPHMTDQRGKPVGKQV